MRMNPVDFARTLTRILDRSFSAVALLLVGLLVGVSVILNVSSSMLVGTSEAGPPLEPGAGLELPRSIPQAGGQPFSHSAPAVALTFDDGPHPAYTSHLLDVLAKHNVKATFFVTGERVIEHGDIIRRMIDEGHEIGLHTHNHSRMGDLSDAEVVRQYELNQQLILGVTGSKPRLARPPYSFNARGLSRDEHRAASVAQDELDLVMVFSDLAPADYRGLSPEQIVSQSIPHSRSSGILTLHDGVDPGHVPEAIDVLIPELRARGYQLLSVSDYGNVAPEAETTLGERLSSRTLVSTVRLHHFLHDYVAPIAYVLAPFLVLRFFALLYLSWDQNRRERRRLAQPIAGAPGVTIIVPAFNEEVGIVDALASFSTLTYGGPLEVLVVDDGSTDRTAELAASVPGVRVLSKPNGGKASALNAGIKEATFEICVLVDGDTVFDPDTITYLVQPLADPEVGAVSGYPRVGNRTNLLSKVQAVEYIMGCSLVRRAQERLGIISCMPGAVGAFRRTALLSVGGVPEQTLAEDTDLTIALGARGWKLAYATRATAWTEVPIDLKTFRKQRVRWSYGVFQVLWKHRRGTVGDTGSRYRWAAMSYIGFDLLLALFTPIVDFLALLAILNGNFGAVVQLTALTFGAQAVMVAYAIHLDREDYGSLRYVPAQVILFRYFNLFVILTALTSAITGRREKWNKPSRVGLSPTKAESRPG